MSDDIQFNIKFVELVEKQPCIYDYTRPDHSKRDAIEKAWGVIASELKLSVLQCKEKWKNLRTAFARSMKKPPSGSGPKKIKDYYLKDVMQFVTPFMKSKPQQGNLPTETESIFNENSDNETEAETNNEEHSAKGITTPVEKSQGTDESTQVLRSDTPNIGPSEKRRKIKSILSKTDKCFIDYVNSKKGSVVQQSHPDLDFLKSLLPDLEKMNGYQKRQFKKRTLEVIDDLLCDGPSRSINTYVPSPVYSNYSTQSNYSTPTTHSRQCDEATAV